MSRRVSESRYEGGGETMAGDQLKSESRPVVSRPRSGPLDGMEPAVQDTVSHAAGGLSATPADESAIRHHERQLAATELLILAERHSDPYVGGQLTLAAVAISRRQVA